MHTTVREANDRGFECLVLADCCGSYFPEFHEVALRMIAAQGGIFGWVGASSRPAGSASPSTSQQEPEPWPSRLWTRGDLNAFFGLGINMLVNVLVLAGLCVGVVHMAPDDVYQVVLPALGIELLVGNLFYFHLARRLASKEGRTDVTAMPYGPSVPHMFIVTLVIMLPTYLATKDPVQAWEAGPRVGLHHRRDHPDRRVRRPDDPPLHAARGAARHARRHLAHVHLDAAGARRCGARCGSRCRSS